MLTLTLTGQDGLEMWAHMAGTDMKAREAVATPAGWCSWYQAFHDIDENYISRNIDNSAFQGYVQVDDGYQESEGDWLLPNKKFPHGIKALATRAHERHLKFGLWVAPFMVSRHSTLFKSHPSWLIKDRHGAPLPLLEWRTGTMFGLDSSHPDAQKWLKDLFSVMTAEWGVDFFKLDFLYLGAAQGVRHKRSWTAAQAYRKGIELIRDAAGERFLLFCGAPLGPSIGIADAMRVSGDAGPVWNGELSASTSLMGTLSRFYMHRRLWINDPDCLILRDRDTGLSLAEVETMATVAALSGGIISFSDDQETLSDERRALLFKLLPPFGKCAHPSSLFSPGWPATFDLRIERPFAAWHVAALFNLSDSAKDLTYQLSSLGMRQKEYLVYELWSDTFLGIARDSIVLKDVPPHGTRLLCVRKLVEHPQFLSSDLHVTQGGVEIGSLAWSRRAKTLRLTIRSLPPHDGRLLFYVPPGFVLRDITCTAERFSSRERDDSLLEVQCSAGEPFQLSLVFE
jgi:alpha-galactosidase